ncbi:MAG: deoxyribodipyrimidine photolyase [Firmicutes bacterium HGW-Firmicutes-11]|jgi:deoxyribodipyrimidine photo-lyase|nr:MAG: deoxyribodipyrimidine photolyase [Firmicutes bacterium HGW-Firmicutes-11]
MLDEGRMKRLNDKAIVIRPFVVYWMQSSQRTEWNHALEYAIDQANFLRKPLIVYFGITDDFPEANERHYAFLLEGLREVKEELKKRKIKLVILHTSPEQGAMQVSKFAAMVVVDRGYLRIERQWREWFAQKADCPVIQIESNVIVPVELASSKEEYSAATLRRKLRPQLYQWLQPFHEGECQISSLSSVLPFREFAIDDIEKVLSGLTIDRSVKRVAFYTGGTSKAKDRLEEFLAENIYRYDERKNEPGESCSSGLSPYLHFGQISPLYIAQRLADIPEVVAEGFLEELIVRRELGVNYVFYNDKYDSYESIPQWARSTLEKHSRDGREYLYTREELEKGSTHDPYWNAAQMEMVLTGKMHGYMRMYWGKKILEWTGDPAEAFSTSLYLNNKYHLDGRDPNGFAGVAWCFGKHDRPWGERAIFGIVRYMNDKGLKRKFDMDKYLKKVSSITL